MEFNKDFFEDEIRNGFYIPGIMKRCWAAAIEILLELDRICKKYNISYYIDYGTLIGAKRHGGFIPWDDDIDISMNREDYNRFAEVVEKEIPPELNFNSLEKSRDYGNVIACLGFHDVSLDDKRLSKYHEFPYMIAIDICINDSIAKNAELEKLRESKIIVLAQLVKKVLDGECSGKHFEKTLKLVESKLQVHFNRKEELKPQVYRLLNKYCKEFEGEKGRKDLYAWIPGALQFKQYYYPQEDVFPLSSISFEGVSFPAPKNVDKILRIEYGDYTTPNVSGGAHNYPYFHRYEKNLIDIAGGEDKWHFRYRFKKEDLEHEKKENIRDMVFSVLRSLGQQEEAMKSREEDYSFLQNTLADIQNTALTIGNTIEQRLGENTETVALLSRYCEILFQAYEKARKGESPKAELTDLKEKRLECEKTLEKEWKKTMLILLDKAKHFSSIEGFYRKMLEREDWEVLLMPIPYCYRKGNGALMEEEIDLENFPKSYTYVDYKAYAFDVMMPDCIVINSPYDSNNMVQSIDPFFYSENMKKYTKNLVYIPWFVTKEIEWAAEEDGKAIVMMDYYVCQPGVAHADHSFVQSETVRKSYIEKLVEFTGEECRAVWEKKIIAAGSCLLGQEEELTRHILSCIEG